MSQNEIRILTKLIRVMSLFLLLHGYKDFDLKLVNDPNHTYITITSAPLSEAMVTLILENLNRKRQLEIETYGWELLGDIDEKSDFAILGSLIDRVEHSLKNNQSVLKLTRVNQYL